MVVGSAMMGAMFFNDFAGWTVYELAIIIKAILVPMSGASMMENVWVKLSYDMSIYGSW